MHSLNLVSNMMKHSIKTLFIRSMSTTTNQSPIVLREDDQRGVRRIVLNHPKKRNALSLEMIRELNHHITDTNSTPSSTTLRAMIISASEDSGKIFSSGHDLKELATNVNREYRRMIFDEFTKLMLNIRHLPVPVICQVDGLAAAAGCQLVASCDLVLATERSQFSTPGANVGLFCSTPGIALARSANVRTAAFMVLTGRPINANESILESILAKSASVIALGKKFFYEQCTMSDLDKAYSRGSDVMVDNLSLKDAQEGLDAFLQKRPPKWTHSDQLSNLSSS